MKNKLLFFSYLFLLTSRLYAGATMRTLEIEFDFAALNKSETQLLGYRLYKEGEQVCETGDPYATKLTCEILTENGTFEFNLGAYFADGTESPLSPPVSHTINSISSPEPPVAGLSPSIVTGNTALTVAFDGTSSIATNSPIVRYSWTLGDGSQATGVTVSHTYTTAGTYYAELTVEDSMGLTDNVGATVIVTEPVQSNEKPIAVISVDTTQCIPGQVISFDGSLSYDPDGLIMQYEWYFGDGRTVVGQSVQHNYLGAAVYNVSLRVTDDKGETTTATKEIACTDTISDNGFNFEVGEVSVDQEWVKVYFENSYNQPIVIVGPPVTVNEEEPVFARIRNIDNDGFEIRLQEWDYQDGLHVPETLSYFVIEEGKYTLNSGKMLEAGSFVSSTTFKKIPLQQSYDLIPVILTQIVTVNETDAATGRVQNINQNSFKYMLQEQQKSDGFHIIETVNYIALEPGKVDLFGSILEVGMTMKKVNQKWFDLTFQTKFPDAPFFIADMQTASGNDPSTVRGQEMTPSAIQIKIEEEQSKDLEIKHANEAVGYIAISAASKQTKTPILSEKQITFAWKYGDPQNVNGFRFYLNDSLICKTSNQADRQLTCNVALLSSSMEFSMTVVFLDGTESTPSNFLTINPADYPDLFGI